MDTFSEQIISIKKTGKSIALLFGIWILALILVTIIFLFSAYLGGLAFLLVVGIIYGAYKLSGLLNIEFEYIVTNGTMDIDKITNKSSRKRIASFELGNTSRLEKFNKAMLNNLQKEVIIACNLDDEGAYLIVSEKEGKGATYVVLAPNQKIQSSMIKFLPKYIANSAFK